MAVDKSGVGANAGDTNLTRFRKTVLTWDYLRLLRESSQKDPRDATETGLKRVKDRYEDVEEYLGVFEPLLFEEVKAQIVQVNEEDVCQEKGAVVSCEESGGFHLVTLVVQDEFPDVTENDLLLLSKEKFEEGKLKTYTFALVESRGNDHTVKARTFLSGEVNKDDKLDAEARRRRLRMLPILTKNETIQTTLHILKVCSLSTIIREYLALHSVVSLPFKNLILSATDNSRDSKLDNNKWNVPRPLMEFLENSHNESQLEAIRAGLARRPFVLIQGPPGTGKTQTILGLLSAVLHSAPSRVLSTGKVLVVKHKAAPLLEEKYRHWTKASPWLIGVNPRDLIMPIDGDDGFYPTSGNEMKPEVVNSNRKYRVHVLVCAPSNSALDEIVLRVLRTGIRDENDDVYNPKIVRIGLKAHHSVQAVSMDYLVEQKLASMDPSTFGKGSASGPMDRDRIRASILDESAIVFSTLSFSGSSHFSRMNRIFDVVIIDEAAQAVEPATLIPFAHGCRQVYLVGDPAQLPATVISTTAKKLGYDTSLFKRFQKAGYPVQMLKTQYRMHPEIRSFPSKEFYSDSLEDGELVEKQTKRLWHDYRCFGPFCFFDIEGVESQPSGSGSLKNEDEIDFILLMYKHLITNYPELKSSSQIAVISPYNEQVKEFRKKFNEIFGKQSNQFVDVNTVDGFQGREKDVAIFSCVRANSGKGIGFVSDVRRMNVGITRARSSILVVGSATTLMQDKHWSNLIESAKLRDCFFKVFKPSSSFFSEANLKSLERIRTKEIKPDQLDEHIAAMENIAVETGEEAPIDDVDMDDGGDGGYDE